MKPGRRGRAARWLAAGCLAATSAGAERMAELKHLTPPEPGVRIPVRIARTLRAGSVAVGTEIVAKATQRIPVSGTAYLKAGTEVTGIVVRSEAGDGTSAHPAVLELRFQTLRRHGQTEAVTTEAIAIANLVQVNAAAVPALGSPDRGNSGPANWTTIQVGGDEVFRELWKGDLLNSSMEKVGFADYDGVYLLPGGSGGMEFPVALGVFSADAHGLYGFEPGTTLASGGGTIRISRVGKNLVMRNGDDLLLVVGKRP